VVFDVEKEKEENVVPLKPLSTKAFKTNGAGKQSHQQGFQRVRLLK